MERKKINEFQSNRRFNVIHSFLSRNDARWSAGIIYLIKMNRGSHAQ